MGVYMKHSNSKFIWGVLFVLFGFLLAMKQLGFLENFTFFFPGWWTLFFVVPCFVGMLSSERNKSHFIWFSIGILIILYSNGAFSFEELWKLLIASTCIVIGFSFLFRNTNKVIQKSIIERDKREYSYKSKMAETRDSYYTTEESWKDQSEEPKEEKTEEAKEEPKMEEHIFEGTNHGNHKSFSAYLSSNQVQYVDEVFQKAYITSLLGNVQLDLRHAIFEGDGVLEVTCILGGIDILVPSTIHVVNHCSLVLAGVDNYTLKGKNAKPDGYTLHIRGGCILGGMNIR